MHDMLAVECLHHSCSQPDVRLLELILSPNTYIHIKLIRSDHFNCGGYFKETLKLVLEPDLSARPPLCTFQEDPDHVVRF